MSMTEELEFDELGDEIREYPAPDVEKVINAFKSEESFLQAFYGLTGLSESEIEKVKPIWEALPLNIRQNFLETAVDMADKDYTLDYRNFGLIARHDSDPKARMSAIQLFMRDEDVEILSVLQNIAKEDEDVLVRATAISGLGMFVLLGEYEEIPRDKTLSVQETLAGFWNDSTESLEVRRRALESLANSQHPLVPDAIQVAYDSDDKLLNISAIVAMGRTYDEKWHDIVLSELENEDAKMRYEAVRASGELSLAKAVPMLAQIMREDDREMKLMVVWALGEIASKQATRVLDDIASELLEDDDEELNEAVEDAISLSSFMGELPDLDF